MKDHSPSHQQTRIVLFTFEWGQKPGLVFMPSKNWSKRDLSLKHEVSCWAIKKNFKKKNLEKGRARHLKKGRSCQKDPSNKKIEVCDKIISSFKVTRLSLSLLYSYIKIYTY